MEKVAVITGASSGIGQATAKLFRFNNYKVFNLDITQPEVSDIDFIFCDVSKPNEIKKAIDLIISKFGFINTFISSAGIHLSKNIENTTEEEFNKVLGINLGGCFFSLKYVLPYMRAQKYGSIVIVGSDQSLVGKRSSAIYGATKGAIAQLAKSIALDYAEYGIRANCVCPGTIDTPLYKKAIDQYAKKSGISLENIEKEEAQQQPLGRIGNPNEVAELIYFLSSDEKSGFITGGLYAVDGGYTAK